MLAMTADSCADWCASCVFTVISRWNGPVHARR